MIIITRNVGHLARQNHIKQQPSRENILPRFTFVLLCMRVFLFTFTHTIFLLFLLVALLRCLLILLILLMVSLTYPVRYSTVYHRVLARHGPPHPRRRRRRRGHSGGRRRRRCNPAIIFWGFEGLYQHTTFGSVAVVWCGIM